MHVITFYIFFIIIIFFHLSFIKVSNHQLISLRFSTKFVFFRAYLVLCSLGVKPLIHQSELGTYTKVVPFQEKVPFTL
jgi:hypothetical protein